MQKLPATAALIANILARTPEAFLHHKALTERLQFDPGQDSTLEQSPVARHNQWWYDTSRLSETDLLNRINLWKPSLPQMTANGYFIDRPIADLLHKREQQYRHEPAITVLLGRLQASGGMATIQALAPSEPEQSTLNHLVASDVLRQLDPFIFDPLTMSAHTAEAILQRQRKEQERQHLTDYLLDQPGQTAALDALRAEFGAEKINRITNSGSFTTFHVRVKGTNIGIPWVRPREADADEARNAAAAVVRDQLAQVKAQEDLLWADLLPQLGEHLRFGARDGKSYKAQVIARTYRITEAAAQLGLRNQAIEGAIHAQTLRTVLDPDGVKRIPAEAVEHALQDAELYEAIAGYEPVTSHDIALVTDALLTTVRRRLQRIKSSRSQPLWNEVRGKWGLPEKLSDFYALRDSRLIEQEAQREAERAAEEARLAEEERFERRQREELRAKLVAAFPAWKHSGRADQQIYLHIGPPNSGKTYEALNALSQATAGWYLAPLRLLAFEIFDRLNQRGVFCNLLTGEEHIAIPGATITAATVEMFNPERSGDCVVIDEAQMLADPDRGWAWTRALMESQASAIHVIGPQTAGDLIEKLASAAAIPVTVIEHQRLAPIQIAEKPWPLLEIPERTILVAFSRQTVLHLKTELERAKRKVSVVYGNLPPEVRRKQADRFASGETEICIATDAVGMGLNLPADYVCFYEVEKYDGRTVRVLSPTEVQQIGGRAGRFGLSKAGEIGATTKTDLDIVQQQFFSPPALLTHARVAPTVEDLELLPGNLATKLDHWASLQSIPDNLRTVIQTADMTERIELARMLTDEQVNQLGLAAALRIVNAPTRQSTRNYWLRCAHAILADKPMPMPPDAPQKIINSSDLDMIEMCVSAADVYLWLANRREFQGYGADEPEVRIRRQQWSMRIDVALAHKLDITRTCSKCGAPLPLRFRYAICNNCFHQRGGRDYAVPDRRPVRGRSKRRR
jgi:dephospho-CoA kinase